MRFPDYDRSSLSITASVMNYFGVKMGYPCLPELDGALKDAAPRVVILMVLDGMGENLLRRRLPENSFFRTHDVCPLSAVFPSTTTAATTSIWSGLSPLEHGWLGWSLYFKECGRQIDTFLNRDSHTGEAYPGPSPAETLMPVPSGFVRLNGKVETHAVFPFPSYSTNGADFVHTYDGRDFADCARVVREVSAEPGRKLVCVYFSEPDHTMHETGVASERTQQNFDSLNAQAEALAKALPRDALMLITADHGLVDATECIDLAQIPQLNECLLMPPSIEARAGSLFVKPGRKLQFEREFKAVCGDEFVLIPHEEVFSSHLLGRGTPHPKCEDFVGDYLACAVGKSYLRYTTLATKPFTLIGQHAGLTDDEMLVPLILARGEA